MPGTKAQGGDLGLDRPRHARRSVRGCVVRDAGRRDQRTGARASSAFTSSGSTSCAPARCSRSRPSARSSRPRRVRGDAEDEFYDRANELGDAAFDAYNELATVALRSSNLPMKTLMGFPRSGDPSLFANSAAVVQAAFARGDRRQRSQQRARRARRGSRARAARRGPSRADDEAARRGARADSRGADARARATSSPRKPRRRS